MKQDRDANARLVTELLAGERQEFQIEKQYRRKDGTSVWVRNNASIVPGTERVPRFLMTLSEDITRRKLSEAALAKARSELANVSRHHKPGGADRRLSHTKSTNLFRESSPTPALACGCFPLIPPISMVP